MIPIKKQPGLYYLCYHYCTVQGAYFYCNPDGFSGEWTRKNLPHGTLLADSSMAVIIVGHALLLDDILIDVNKTSQVVLKVFFFCFLF